jgi:transposase InsO family protein
MQGVSAQPTVGLLVPFPAGPVKPGEANRIFTFPADVNLSAAGQAEADRRYRVIEPFIAPDRFEALWSQHGGRKAKLVERTAQQHGISPSTVYRWLKDWDEAQLWGLVPKTRSDKGNPSRLNAAAINFIVAAAHPRQGVYGSLSAREIHRLYCEEKDWRAAHREKPLNRLELQRYAAYLDENDRLSEAAQLPAVSYETVRCWFNRIPEVTKTLAREGVEAFANTQEIISYRAIADIQPLDYLVLDHRMLDLFCMARTRGGWRLIRPWLTAALDFRTRKWLSHCIVAQPSSDSIASVLKSAFLRFGLPKTTYVDHGKDFTAEFFEGSSHRRGEKCQAELGTVMGGVLATLGIQVCHAIVKRARSKIIEPNFLRPALFEKTLPWYCGNAPDTRPEAFQRLIERHQQWSEGKIAEAPFPVIEEIARIYDDLLNSLNDRELKGEGMGTVRVNGRGWMSPNEAWEKLIPRVEMRTVPAEVLAFCFRKRKELTVRHGEICITFGGRQYHYRLAENPAGLMLLNGRRVEVGLDPYDLETIAIYHDGKFVGLGHQAELRRMGEQGFIEDEKVRRASRRETRRAIDILHRQEYVPESVERLKRRIPALPVRTEPERLEAPAAIPAPIMDAVHAAEEEKRFSFAGVQVMLEASDRMYRDDDPDDGRFDFWGGEK